jgi:hypothetical protein
MGRIKMNAKEMIEELVCPGCVGGSNTECGYYALVDGNGSYACSKHVLGTFSPGIGSFALGLPKGFCRAGYMPWPEKATDKHNTREIRCWPEGAKLPWDHLNVPVWAMEKDGFLFVRTYSPRINFSRVDVVEKGTLALVPNAIDVGKFIDEID